MEASRACPAAGQMLCAPRFPRAATKRLDSEKAVQLDQTAGVSSPLGQTPLDDSVLVS